MEVGKEPEKWLDYITREIGVITCDLNNRPTNLSISDLVREHPNRQVRLKAYFEGKDLIICPAYQSGMIFKSKETGKAEDGSQIDFSAYNADNSIKFSYKSADGSKMMYIHIYASDPSSSRARAKEELERTFQQQKSVLGKKKQPQKQSSNTTPNTTPKS